MDRWALVITGMGPHHSGQDVDVEKLAADFITAMRAAGHGDVRCTLTSNGRDERVEPVARTLTARPVQLEEPAVSVKQKV